MYYYKEVMEKRLKERNDKINSNIIFYQNKLGSNKGYKLYSEESHDVSISLPNEKKNVQPIVVAPKNNSNIVNETAKSKNEKPISSNSAKANSSKSTKKNKKKKGIIAAIVAIAMAGAMTITGLLLSSKVKKKDDDIVNDKTISKVTDKIGTGSLDSLGEKLPKQDKKNSEYVKISGDFNIEDVVRGADGRLYVDAESARNAQKAGTVDIDTKGGTLRVDSSGKVYTQSEGYVIVDENGNVIESGEGSPSTQEDGVDYVECPNNYYDDEGNLVHSVGEFITPEELQVCKTYYHTTKPKAGEYDKVTEEIIYDDNSSQQEENNQPVQENNKTSQEEQKDETKTVDPVGVNESTIDEREPEQEEVNTSSNDQGVTNADGTYTIYGITYASYADYQQYIFNNGEGYGFINGIIQPIGDYEIENQYTK